MKYLFFVIALALSSAAFSSQAATPDNPQNATIRALAERPMGFVVGNECKIRGAVWAGGPRAHVAIAFIDVISGESFTAKTNSNGVYALSIPYAGKPLILQERITDQVRVVEKFAKDAQLLEGGVVCDHRLTLRTPSTSKENK